MNPAPKPVIVSRKGRDPSDVPGKAHRCICGSGRRYGRCCKRALVATIKVYAAAPKGARTWGTFPLLETLAKWQAQQKLPKYMRAAR